MKSLFRLYTRTSKGNQRWLQQQLLKQNIKIKYDELLHSFYFNCGFETLFELSFHFYSLEQMYIQIGQKFRVDQEEQTIACMNRLPLMNYLPLKLALLEQMQVEVMIRQSHNSIMERHVLRDLQNVLRKKIVETTYHQQIKTNSSNQLTYEQINQLVLKKWKMEQKQSQILQIQSTNTDISNKSFDNHSQQISYSPQMLFYIRKNQGRLLLKLNKQSMYKHGWKTKVGWGPIRQSIIASVLQRAEIIQKAQSSGKLNLWDPFCGSGTIGLVSAAMCQQIPVRTDIASNFIWQYFPIYRSLYLQHYWEKKKHNKLTKKVQYCMIMSDINSSTINHCIGNFQHLAEQWSKIPNNNNSMHQKSLFNLTDPTLQYYQLLNNQVLCIKQDFQKVIEIIKIKNESFNKLNIVTNLPYIKQRSINHHPLNQLVSIYRRFNNMIRNNSHLIDNVYIMINDDEQALRNQNHFLSLATQSWQLLCNFMSGGISIGMYGWCKNKNKNIYQLYQSLQSKDNNNILINKSINIQKQLQIYRQKLSNIDKKRYLLPKRFIKTYKGWKRVQQKRKRRHLLIAYELFSKQKDKKIALKTYINKKLQLKMLKRGTLWKKSNLGLLGQNVEKYKQELKKQFEKKIENAVEKSQLREKRIQMKRNKHKQEIKYRNIKLNQKDYKNDSKKRITRTNKK